MSELYSKFSEEVSFPRGLIIWNYFDHEHVVGTHFEHYHQIRILAEEKNWCFSQRSATLPFIPIRMWATQFSYLKSDKWMRSFHFGPLGLLLEQDFHFEDLERQSRISQFTRGIGKPLSWVLPPLWPRALLQEGSKIPQAFLKASG